MGVVVVAASFNLHLLPGEATRFPRDRADTSVAAMLYPPRGRPIGRRLFADRDSAVLWAWTMVAAMGGVRLQVGDYVDPYDP